MTAAFTIIARPRTGTRRGPAFVDYADGSGELTELEIPIYAPDGGAGKRLRAARLSVYLSLHDAAELLGIRPSELSGLERGSHEARGVPTDHVAAVLLERAEKKP